MWFFFISVRKNIYIWKNPISNILTISLESSYCQDFFDKYESASISTIAIIVGGGHGQGKFRSVSKFILRDIRVKTLELCVIKNDHIDCDKDTYDVLNDLIVKPLNEEMK